MSINNLAIEKFPQSFEEIYGHKEEIKFIKNWIEKDKLPPAIMLSGDSGVGKGCLAHNIIKTTLCQNRKPDVAERCNKCDVCLKMDPRNTHPSNNVMWIQIGSNNQSTIDAQVKEAISYAQTPPMGNRLVDIGSKYHKFIVIDEIQSIKQTLLEQLFMALENGPSIELNRVTFILITMNEAYLESKNPMGFKAIKDRVGRGYIPLQRPSDARLHQYALDVLNIENIELREILVEAAEGSYRGLLAKYESLLDLPSLDNLNLVQTRLQLASYSTRVKFWELFSKGSNELWSYWKVLKQDYVAHRIVKQLYSDIISSTNVKDIPLEFFKAMREYLKDPLFLDAYYIVFAPFMGTFTVTLPPLTHESSIDNVSVI